MTARQLLRRGLLWGSIIAVTINALVLVNWLLDGHPAPIPDWIFKSIFWGNAPGSFILIFLATLSPALDPKPAFPPDWLVWMVATISGFASWCAISVFVSYVRGPWKEGKF